MTDTGTPREFLAEALAAVDTLKDDKAAQAETSVKLKEAERALNTLRKTIEKEKADTVKARRDDIESDYAKQLKASESNISKAENERSKARTKGVNDRIAESLVPAKAEIKDLRAQIAAIVKSSGLPAYCKGKAFYTLFCAKGVGEILKLVLLFLLVLVALPFAVTLLLEKTWMKIAAFILIDAAAVLVYILIYSATVAKKQDAVAQCRLIVDRIKSDEKIVKQIKKNIKNDKDDSSYNLGNYDEEINRHTALRDDISQKRQQALSEFDYRTAETIKNDIEERYAGKLMETQNCFNQLSDELKEVTDRITAEEMEISRYTQYVGAKNLNHENLQKMIDLVDAGEAQSVSDAALKINSKQ